MPDNYRPENFTQGQINAGQRKINFALTQADEHLVAVLTILKCMIQAGPGHAHTYEDAIDAALKAATRAINHVAEIRPPGCDTGGQP